MLKNNSWKKKSSILRKNANKQYSKHYRVRKSPFFNHSVNMDLGMDNQWMIDMK